MFKRIILVLFVLCFLIAGCNSKDKTYSCVLKVEDDKGNFLANSEVVFISNGKLEMSITNEKGEIILEKLSEDNSKVIVSKQGYISKEIIAKKTKDSYTVILEEKAKVGLEFFLIGSNLIEIEKGTQYVEPGFTATIDGKDVKDDVLIKGVVDINKVGKYEIIYKLFTEEKKRVVEIIPVKSGIIFTLNGSSNVKIEVGTQFQDLGVTATFDGYDVSQNLEVTSNVDINKAGKYLIKYKMNFEGVVKELTRNVEVTSVYVGNAFRYNYSKETFPIGANIGEALDFSRIYAFADMMKSVYDLGGNVDIPFHEPDKLEYYDENGDFSGEIDENGWPMKDFGIVVMRDQGYRDTSGTYKMSFECSVIPDISFKSSVGKIENIKRDKESGIVTADIVIGNTSTMMLGFKETNGGVRNLKILRPGYTEEQTFTKEFLDHFNRFSVIRSMDFTFTNNNEQRFWSDRQKPNDGPHSGILRRGVAWEHVIELGNTVKADIWINIPHMVDDEYIRNLAILIKKTLDPDLKVYFEYSNENWNYIFTQFQWCIDEATGNSRYTGLIKEHSSAVNKWQEAYVYAGVRLKEASDIFREVFGDGEMLTRVRPVLGGMFAGLDSFKKPLEVIEKKWGDPNKFFYGLAIAPYYNMGSLQEAHGLNVDEVINSLSNNVNTKDYSMVTEIAEKYGLKQMTYEGGTDTFGKGSIEAKEKAQRDPRHKEIITRYLHNWYKSGGDIFTWYLGGASSWSTQYGTWGLTDNIFNDNGAKIEAIDEIISKGFEKYEGGILEEDIVFDENSKKYLIDFEDQPFDTGENLQDDYTVNGLKITSNRNIKIIKDTMLDEKDDYKTKVLHGNSYGITITIEKADGSPLNLQSAKFFKSWTAFPKSVKIKMYKFESGINIDNVNLYEGSELLGTEYKIKDEWKYIGYQKIEFYFLTEKDGNGDGRMGAIDDLEFF